MELLRFQNLLDVVVIEVNELPTHHCPMPCCSCVSMHEFNGCCGNLKCVKFRNKPNLQKRKGGKRKGGLANTFVHCVHCLSIACTYCKRRKNSNTYTNRNPVTFAFGSFVLRMVQPTNRTWKRNKQRENPEQQLEKYCFIF